MKKIYWFLLVCFLFLCGCAVKIPQDSHTSTPNNDALQSILKEYESRLQRAAVAEDLQYIQINDVTITNKESIIEWLTVLQKLELKPQPFNGGIEGESGCEILFAYPEETVYLGTFFSSQIDIYYDGPPAKYMLEILNTDTGNQLRNLSKECGAVRH